MTKISRRQALGVVGGSLMAGAVAGGKLVAGGMTGQAHAAAPGTAARFQFEEQPFSWQPHILDPEECAVAAYDGYWHKGFGCGYGVFYGIVGMMAEKYGAPYNQFPFSMLEVGKSGISGWATICGALLGGASAYALFWGRKERDPMVTELYRWYEQTAFPIFNPGTAAKGFAGDLPTSIAHSPLCHVSVSKWCYETGIAEKSKERSERCARITADVAKKAVEIMNAKQTGAFVVEHKTPESVEYCGSCHGAGKESPIVKGKMDCAPCHSGSEHTQDKYNNHP